MRTLIGSKTAVKDILGTDRNWIWNGYWMMFRNFSISFPLNTTQEQYFRNQEQPQAYSTLLKPLSAQPERQTKFQSLGREVRQLSFHYKRWHLFFCSLQKYIISLRNVGRSTQCHSFSRSGTNSAYFSANAHEELDRFPLILAFLPSASLQGEQNNPLSKSLLLSHGCAVHIFPCIPEIAEWLALCKVLWEDSEIDHALKESAQGKGQG